MLTIRPSGSSNGSLNRQTHEVPSGKFVLDWSANLIHKGKATVAVFHIERFTGLVRHKRVLLVPQKEIAIVWAKIMQSITQEMNKVVICK